MNKKILLLWGLLLFLIGVSIITNEYSNSGNSVGPAIKNDIIEEDKNYFELEPPKKAAGETYGWMWVSGDKTTDEYGVYGTKGVPDIANCPGARHDSVSWTDTDGNFWLFGGYGYDELGAIGWLNDLWRFNITSKEWAWISGAKTIDNDGVYGTKGVPDIANRPGGRLESVSWTDMDGNLWLFGGWGYTELDFGLLNDLWRFNITSKEWAWISGNETADEYGVYGTKGVPDIANYPGARECSASWTDTNGNLWLFGGNGYAESVGVGRLNDLWRFNIASKEWAWISGAKTTNQNGFYFTKGVPFILNCPGSRLGSVSWTDTDGSLWLFGGYGYPGSGTWGYLNDLWRFNIASNEWTWISGNKTLNEYGKYGTKGIPDIANYPGARWSSVSWTDTYGNFWLFGGWGYAESGDDGYLNDLWRFNITSNEWAWISGNKTTDEYGIYGTKGVPDTANYPGARCYSVSWTDTDGNFWLFGGAGYSESGGSGRLNDLWMFGSVKDSIAPKITIIEPKYNKLFNATAPSYNLTFIDAHLDDTWYRLWNGTEWSINYTIPGIGSERTGQINQDAWNDCPNGSVIIEFYANDTSDNLRMNSTTIRKDILGPTITINNPQLNDLFFSTAPGLVDCNVTFSDVSGIDARWYMLINGTDNTDYTNNYTWNDEVDQFVWDYMENGTVIIRIFANDSSGFIGMAEITVRKNIELPNIVITKPTLNDIFGNNTMNFTISVSGKDLDTIWYMLINGTNSNDYTNNLTYSDSVIAGIYEALINYNLWNQFENGTVIIRFFLNRTDGVMSFDDVLVRKDILGPIITINAPTPNELFSSTAPGLADCNVLFSDVSGIDARWYMLINGTDTTDYTNNYTWNGKVDQFVWNYMDNGTVIIRIFANDSLGNIGIAEVTLRKDIELPNIDINDPILNDIYGINTMNFTISVSGRNLDTIWYMLINGTNSNDYTNNVTYSDSVIAGIYEDTLQYNLWNQFENGTVVIRFFLNRTNGLMAFDDVLVRKDIIAPNITIIEPIEDQSVYNSPPEFTIIVVETNNDTMWYRLFNGTDYTENRTFISNTKINETDWDAMWNSIDYGEIIWIIFYCNDTAGNIGFANVTMIKSQAPSDGVIPPPAGDDDDDDEQAISFGNFYLLFIVVGILGGVLYYRKKKKS